MNILLGFLICCVVGMGYYIYRLRKDIEHTEQQLDTKAGSYKKLLSQKKKSEIRLGLIAEKLTPFLDGFDHDPNNLIFLGNPIDYIVFNDDEIIFLEVKSGKSRLTKSQRTVRDNIKKGNIKWEVFRID